MTNLSWEALKDLHDHFAAVAVNHFNQRHEVSSQLFIVQMKNSGTPAELIAMDPEMLNDMMSSEQGKENFAEFLRDMLTDGSGLRQSFIEVSNFEPDVLVQVTEAWVSSMTGPDVSEQSYVQPSLDPQRQECVLVVLHTQFGSIPVMHPVTATPERRCALAEFPAQKDLPAFGGRMAIQPTGAPPGAPLH